MKLRDSRLVFAATDLSNHLACRHLSILDRDVAAGKRPKPEAYDPRLAVLAERGREHEVAYLAHLRDRGSQVLELSSEGGEATAREATREAMRNGVDAIAQASLGDRDWGGRADVLLRVEHPSDLGGWSYEPVDTKLAEETRGGTILQLVVYAELLGEIQGTLPERVGVVTPLGGFMPEWYRVDEYHAFVRRARRRFEESLAGAGETYPLPNAHCAICRWWRECDARWRQDDHLSLVAGMRRLHARELETTGITTLGGFAHVPVPLVRAPSRGSKEALERLREQARVQLESRESGRLKWELLPLSSIEERRGLARLPEPSPGDVFLDFEGDPFMGEGGLEYLFGLVTFGEDGSAEYHERWAFDRRQERNAFESLMDDLTERRVRDPDLHVYHFGDYEASALKRLMGRYATREDELDRWLRGERLVDLHRVTTQSVRIGVESYSLKKLEPLIGFERQVSLELASRALRRVEAALELGNAHEIGEELKRMVAGYNRDDCLSTARLRDWLEGVRKEAIDRGVDLTRPPVEPEQAAENLTEWLIRVRALAERLLEGLPADLGALTAEERARRILAHSLQFHRREDKVGWWEFYRLAQLAEDERIDEPKAIAGLRFVRRIPAAGGGRLPTDEYSFPPQEVDRRAKDARIDQKRKLGSIEELDPAGGRVKIKKTRVTLDEHPASVFLHGHVDKKVLEEALVRLGEWVADHGMDAPGKYRAARDLLLSRSPRGCIATDGALGGAGEDVVSAARRLVVQLDRGVLPLQGPPGAGKTYTGARMIAELVRRGKKVGVTAMSHKVISKLLDEAVKAAREEGLDLCCLQKGGDERVSDPGGSIRKTEENAEIVAALASGTPKVVAGTAWLWAREDLADSVDVLFVDEAGQMSVADVLAASQAAASLVLLGDPQQLEQPIQASHPEGTAVAALTHLLAGRPTIDLDRGLFLDQTWRLHPLICAFTSEQFYEGRLHSRSGLERQTVAALPTVPKSGLYFLPVEHEGNQSSSEEEARVVADLVRGWLDGQAEWTDGDGCLRTLTAGDVLIVVPYNAQVHRLQQLLPDVPVGTVDKFQGQEAPVVIYSMVTSTPEDAPRGMEFLYSRNRLNVATSRARCACVLVACPVLLEPECRTPRHLSLANALCRYVEMATILPMLPTS